MKGAVSEPLTVEHVRYRTVRPRKLILTHSQCLVCNKYAGQIWVTLKRVKGSLESGELRLVPRWQGLKGEGQRNFLNACSYQPTWLN